jgi:hypothetical protein
MIKPALKGLLPVCFHIVFTQRDPRILAQTAVGLRSTPSKQSNAICSKIVSMTVFDISPSLRAHLESALRQPIAALEPIHHGYSPALRLRAHLRDGSTVFIKSATTSGTAEMLRSEYAVYTALDAPFMARLIAWGEGDASQGIHPFLALEDLSAAHWPPPWTPRRIDQVVDLLASLGRYTFPGLPPIDADELAHSGWASVAGDPRPFLSLGFATQGWLDRSLPILLAASRPDAVRGDVLIHTDVRSDNLSFDGERVILIDWNWACLGNPTMDLAAWLPSLEAEGGPPPETFLADGGTYAAIVSGYFAACAGLPVVPLLPRLREVQLQQLRTALPWAVRSLELPPLDGPQAGR